MFWHLNLTPCMPCGPTCLAPAHLPLHLLRRTLRRSQLLLQFRHAALCCQKALHLLRCLADLRGHVVAQTGNVCIAGLQLRLQGHKPRMHRREMVWATMTAGRRICTKVVV